MAQVTITIPDAIAPRLRDAYCSATGYPEFVYNPSFNPEQEPGPGNEEMVANPQNKMAWVKERIIQHIVDTVLATEMGTFDSTQRTARTAQVEQIKTELALS